KTLKTIILSAFGAGLLLATSALQGQNARPQQRPPEVPKQVLENTNIRAAFSDRGVISLTDPQDKYKADLINSRSPWGRVKLAYRSGAGDWTELPDSVKVLKSGTSTAEYISVDKNAPLTMDQRFTLNGEVLDYDITVKNTGTAPVEIGDLGIFLPWRTASGENPEYIFENCFTKHHYISGNGSFIFFTKPSGEPPFIMILPKKGTKLEYFDGGRGGYKAYIHSSAAAASVATGTWRQENTSLTLDPAKGKSQVNYGFKIKWADSWDDMRQTLYEEGLFDIRVVPGMTIPTDLTATFSLHTKNKIDSIVPEFSGKTTVNFLGEKQPGHLVYNVSFSKLGENMLTVWYGNGQKTYLEFFSTEPLETLVKKRSSFIVNSTQHRDTSKWYNGLYSAYDMKNGILRGPDNTDGYDGWWGYVLASDDPGLCKAPYVAAKNVYFPDDKEIASVEYYLKEFVWNGLQRTDKDDPYPYGIYGVPNWKEARDPAERSKISTTNLDKMHIWRSYDYPHIIMLYYHMYQVAKMYPEKVNYLDAAGYLERAYQTAKAYFIYPYEILPWYETYKWGCYNELVIEPLIADLEKAGRSTDAAWLRSEYEKKVKYFVYDDVYPFRSEYALDRTAFESSYAFAKYGTLNEMKPDKNLWYDKNDSVWYSHPVVRKEDSRDFMERQNLAGLAVRGWLETKYFLLGSDFTNSSDNHSLSYMARMGGWGILDYGINFSEKPYDWLQLGYASYLSSFALMNTGTAETDYGFWFPGKQNDGAMGWAFMESKTGRAWIRKDIDRGAWYYDGEADLGNGAIFRTAQTVLSDDPLFGWISYGGVLTQAKKGFYIIPRDGVRSRFAIATEKVRKTLSLDHDGFAAEKQIIVSPALDKVTFTLENRGGGSHTSILTVTTPEGTEPVVTVDGKKVKAVKTGATAYEAVISVSKPTHKITVQ
ncbi:MAG TPA: DUF5695 domain-containing protein, partial [Bacteroidales bacterium]|nr:DUF5695 domain-containing protein [Bacteroidales bacterium]